MKHFALLLPLLAGASLLTGCVADPGYVTTGAPVYPGYYGRGYYSEPPPGPYYGGGVAVVETGGYHEGGYYRDGGYRDGGHRDGGYRDSNYRNADYRRSSYRPDPRFTQRNNSGYGRTPGYGGNRARGGSYNQGAQRENNRGNGGQRQNNSRRNAPAEGQRQY